MIELNIPTVVTLSGSCPLRSDLKNAGLEWCTQFWHLLALGMQVT